jgi:hypothetical protein
LRLETKASHHLIVTVRRTACGGAIVLLFRIVLDRTAKSVQFGKKEKSPRIKGSSLYLTWLLLL